MLCEKESEPQDGVGEKIARAAQGCHPGFAEEKREHRSGRPTPLDTNGSTKGYACQSFYLTKRNFIRTMINKETKMDTNGYIHDATESPVAPSGDAGLAIGPPPLPPALPTSVQTAAMLEAAGADEGEVCEITGLSIETLRACRVTNGYALEIRKARQMMRDELIREAETVGEKFDVIVEEAFDTFRVLNKVADTDSVRIRAATKIMEYADHGPGRRESEADEKERKFVLQLSDRKLELMMSAMNAVETRRSADGTYEPVNGGGR